MTVMRKQQYILYIYIVALVVSQVCIQFLITRFGFVGASIDYLIGMLCITMFMFIVFVHNLHNKS
ncbi:polysaccharide biosynthesis C-terminal domain-containing protein [Holdemanella biformis]